MWKKQLDDSNSAESFLVQPLWSNTNFKFKGKTLYFEKWVKSGLLYLKDIFNENWLLKSSEQIIDILNKKSSWICEYKIIYSKWTFIRLLQIPYIALQPLSIDKQYSTKIFYSELVKAKFQPPIPIVKWNIEFDISEKKEMGIYLFKQN